jgi:hypothetical protein
MLADRLTDAEDQLRGYVTILPFANPIGLGQVLHGDHSGRFDFYDGRNFNRDYPDLTNAAGALIGDRLGPDASANVDLIRAALVAALDAARPEGPADTLRHRLLRLAVGADVVLDLHCDGEAEVHLYTQPASIGRMLPLAAFTGCRAVLLADESGGHPFDEALSRPWIELARRFPDVPIPAACATCTLELRGRSDVCRDLGAHDAEALYNYLVQIGVVDGSVNLPELNCSPTPLAGSEALTAPAAGLLSYRAKLGAHVAAGEIVAEITDLPTGHVTPVRARTSGIFYARPATRIAEVAKRLGKIAGAEPFRGGLLLSP